MTPLPELQYQSLYYERSIQSVANATRRDATEFMPAAVTAGVRAEVEVFALTDANRALQLLKRGAIQGAGVLLTR